MAILKGWITRLLVTCILLAPVLVSGSSTQAEVSPQSPALYNPHDVDRLSNGHTLITDGGYPAGGIQPAGSGSRVLEVDAAGSVVWSFSDGLDFAHSAQRLPNGNVLISDTGNDRVIEVNPSGNVVWNSDLVTLSDGSTLNYPNDADWLSAGNHLLITDCDNHRVIEIARNGTVIWQFGVTGQPGSDGTHLRGPHNADRLSNGNTIIADSENDRIIEITPSGTIAWEYHPAGPDHLDWPRDADRLDNGNTLVTDSRRMRLVEVTPSGQLTWQYGDLDMPYDADRLPDGNTLISKFSRGRVIEVDQTGAVIWSYPPGLFDVDVPSASTGVPTGTLALRIEAPLVGSTRYAEGAPVIVWLPGGFEARDLQHGLPDAADDLLIVTFLFPGGADVVSGRRSDGDYDYRGTNSVQALADVVRYAAGDLTDSLGRTIDQVVPVSVLHDNIGLIGVSNGGNIIVAAPALYGSNLAGHLRYIIQWETPVSSQIATRDLGRVWMKPSTAQGDYFNPRYLGYDSLILVVSYSDLTYNPAEPYYQVFLDGNGDGQYTTIPEETGALPQPPDPDLDGSGKLEMDEDFPLDTYPEGTKQVYSRAVTQALDDSDVFTNSWPANLATPAEADAYWDIREAVRLYSSAMASVPSLEAMVLASVRDHVQSAPDKPHIRQAFEGWRSAGAWVQINPSPSYLRQVDPTLDPASLPDNVPNTLPADWADADAYCIPENVADSTYQLAAVWQMADRAQRGQIFLPLIVKV